MNETWVAVDTKTDKIVAFGSQSDAQLAAGKHADLSGNEVIIRKLRIGMVLSGLAIK